MSGITIVSVKTLTAARTGSRGQTQTPVPQTAGDTGTGHVADHTAGKKARRPEQESARGRTKRAIEQVTCLMIPSRNGSMPCTLLPRALASALEFLSLLADRASSSFHTRSFSYLHPDQIKAYRECVAIESRPKTSLSAAVSVLRTIRPMQPVVRWTNPAGNKARISDSFVTNVATQANAKNIIGAVSSNQTNYEQSFQTFTPGQRSSNPIRGNSTAARVFGQERQDVLLRLQPIAGSGPFELEVRLTPRFSR